MTPQELKNSILQLAIQGKLVEQRPEEGTGEELYRQIQEEKQRLIKEGKIKKEKLLPEIAEDEKPFEIPESWKWVRLESIVYNHGQTVPSETFSYIDIGSIDNKYQRLNANENLINAGETPSRARKIVKQGDILYSTVRPYLHNMCIIDKVFSCMPIASTGFAVLTCHSCISNKYLFYYLMSPTFDNYANANENSKGVAYPAINDDRLYRATIALPPLAEQKRIVTKIEELLPYIDRYEQAWNRLENFNKRFPDDMKKSILQLAIQGKLVEQLPEEGTAEELYQQIQAEKQQLINAGIIKKEKKLTEIMKDEIPFNIPKNWKWVRLGDAAWFFDAGKSPNCQKQSAKGDEWGVITTTSIQLGFFDDIQNKVLPDNFAVTESMQVKVGDILITRAGPVNRTGIACLVQECRFNLILSDKTLRINMTNQYIYKDYVVMVLNSPQIRQMIIRLMSGMDKQQVNISQDKYKTLLIPIPPLEEQKRIMTKLEEILPLCERLI